MATHPESRTDVSITGYGGIGEIGGNKLIVEAGGDSVILDFGMSFGAEGEFFEEYLQPRSTSKLHDLLRLDLVPALDGLYRRDALTPPGIDALTDSRAKSFWDSELTSYETASDRGDWTPDAVFISHAHLDHIGYLPYLGDIPIVWSETTERVAAALGEIGPSSGFDGEFIEMKPRSISYAKGGYFPDEPKITTEDPVARTTRLTSHRDRVSIGSALTLESFDIGHSIPGAQAALLETDDRQLVYTGDIRFHGRSGHDLGEELAGLRPDVMLCEGTRITNEDPDDEAQVERELTDYAADTAGLVLVAFAWKDLERYETLLEVADAVDRQLVVDPRLAALRAQLGGSIYDDGAKAFVERSGSMLYSPTDYVRTKHKAGEQLDWENEPDVTHLENGVTAAELNDAPHRYIVQLDYYRFKNLVDFELPEGSVFIRAQTEPFNTEMELSDQRLQNWLEHFGLNAENDHEPYQTHASGHAAGVDLLDLIDKLQPRTLVPIHTEHPDAFENEHGDIVEPTVGEPITI